ncbi:flagellar protein FlgN [Paenibacillus chungangensis]|uniref:Flagellar protein FlgN n=1 Tax=Paenibacillus chungangensis TaxID=696535 RepID=A0ABW3HK76_9BACL
MSIAAIVTIMEQQLALYEKLLVIEEDKKRMIMGNEVVQLNVLTQKERLLVAKTEELETQRLLETARYFKNIGFRNRSGLLSDLIKSVHVPLEKQQLIQLYEQLTGILAKLKHVNEANQLLIQQSLDFINFSIGLMVEDPNEDVVYKHPMNQLNGSKRMTMFDSRA